MTELPRRYNVTITVDRDGGSSPNPAEFAVAAGQAASARAASIVSAHTASHIIGIVTVLAADRPAAVAVALAVVSDALSVRSRHPSADGTALTDLMRRLIEPAVPVILGAARPAPQRQVAHPGPGFRPRELARRCMAARRFSAAYREQANAVRAVLGLVGKEWYRLPYLKNAWYNFAQL